MSVKEFFERNYWLIIMATYMTAMCGIFNDTGFSSNYYLGLLLASAFSMFMLLGLRKDNTDKFKHRLPTVVMIGIIPAIFGIAMQTNLVGTLLIITFGNIFYISHRYRAKSYDEYINPVITSPYDMSEVKRKKRNNTIDKLLGR
jgi:uncharacterized membrane protein